MREVKMPSGAILKVNPAPFSEAKALYKAILAEVKDIKLASSTELANVFKDVFCAGFSSEKIEVPLAKCMLRCLYNDEPVKDSCFEKVDSREDYMQVCLEVAKENLLPFGKDLYALFKKATQSVEKSQA